MTTLIFRNSSPQDINLYLTLGLGVSGFVDDVYGIWGIQEHGDKATIKVPAHSPKLIYDIPSDKGISGTLSINDDPQNCYPEKGIGNTVYEFTLNNWMQGGPDDHPQESMNISCVSGVSHIFQVTLDPTGGKIWNASSLHEDVRFFYNDEYKKNTNLVGVFPFGCDNCTWIDNPPVCPNHPPFETPSDNPICIVMRDARPKENCQGTVFVEFMRTVSNG